MGSPATVVSGNLMVRLMTVWKTTSPKAWTTRSMTSRACRVRESNIVPRVPRILRSGLRRSCTFSMVSVSRAMPRRAKNSHSKGMMTQSEAVRALIVSSPRDGAQSMRMTSYSSRTRSMTLLRVCSRATSLTSCTSAADRSMLAGSRSMPSMTVSVMTSCGSPCRDMSRV